MEGYKIKMKTKLDYQIKQHAKKLKSKQNLEKELGKMKDRPSNSREDTPYLQVAYEEQQIRVQIIENKKVTLETTLRNLQYRYDHQVQAINTEISQLSKKEPRSASVYPPSGYSISRYLFRLGGKIIKTQRIAS